MTDEQNGSSYAEISHHDNGLSNCGYKKKTLSVDQEKIWVEKPIDLVKNTDIIPRENMSHAEKFNSITRLILLISMLMFALKYKQSLNFFCLALIIILILYFTTNKEYYNQMDAPPKYKYPLIAQNSKSQKKMSVAPRMSIPIVDKDVWSYPSHIPSGVNSNNKFDITDQYIDVPNREHRPDTFDPRLATYTNFSLQRWGEVPSQTPVIPSVTSQSNNPYGDSYMDPQQDPNNNYDQSQYSFPGSNPNPQSTPIDQIVGPSIEGFAPIRFTAEDNNVTPIGNIYQQPRFQQPRQRFQQQNRKFNQVDSNFATIPNLTSSDYLPDQSLLIPQTISSIYGEDQVSRPERMKYFTQIGPSENFYSDTTTPINANIGISYNPDIPPMILDQTITPYGRVEPLFHSIDPQLIRDGGLSDVRKAQLPRRTSWSAKHSGFEAQDGTVNFEDIYDPRFNGYGDPYRSYQETNSGTTQYYYGDVDRFRDPNFGGRSRVDFIEYTDPMGKVIPEYDRKVGLNDIKSTVHSQYDSDAIYQREDLMSKLMRKRNTELWQLRKMPQRKDAHAGTFSSHY